MDRILKAISKVMPKIALKLKNDAVEFCPKDTGYLARSIKIIKQTDDKIIIGTNVEYAPYVEFGTERMIKAHGPHDYKSPVKDWEAKRMRGSTANTTMPFLAPALYQNLRWIRRMIAEAIKDEFK